MSRRKGGTAVGPGGRRGSGARRSSSTSSARTMRTRSRGCRRAAAAGSRAARPPVQRLRALRGRQRLERAPQGRIGGRRRIQALEERADVEAGAAHHHRAAAPVGGWPRWRPGPRGGSARRGSARAGPRRRRGDASVPRAPQGPGLPVPMSMPRYTCRESALTASMRQAGGQTHRHVGLAHPGGADDDEEREGGLSRLAALGTHHVSARLAFGCGSPVRGPRTHRGARPTMSGGAPCESRVGRGARRWGGRAGRRRACAWRRGRRGGGASPRARAGRAP